MYMYIYSRRVLFCDNMDISLARFRSIVWSYTYINAIQSPLRHRSRADYKYGPSLNTSSSRDTFKCGRRIIVVVVIINIIVSLGARRACLTSIDIDAMASRRRTSKKLPVSVSFGVCNKRKCKAMEIEKSREIRARDKPRTRTFNELLQKAKTEKGDRTSKGAERNMFNYS